MTLSLQGEEVPFELELIVQLLLLCLVARDIGLFLFSLFGVLWAMPKNAIYWFACKPAREVGCHESIKSGILFLSM